MMSFLKSKTPHLILSLVLLIGLVSETFGATPQWDRYELTIESAVTYANPVQDASITATFTSATGEIWTVPGFWDGGSTWKVRFAPRSVGKWSYLTKCSDTKNRGLHGRKGTIECSAAQKSNPFQTHGPVGIGPSDRHFTHADGTPFFYLADTAWNGPLLSTESEWSMYVSTRAEQKFNAVQWVTTQWRAAPNGDRLQQKPYVNANGRIEINPAFFQRLDKKVDQMNEAGLLSVPVLLWAIGAGSDPSVNPGQSLSDAQAIILARYMVARWGAHDVLWVLAGDGDYRGAKAERWKKIGRAVFGDIDHAPVTIHPGGMQWSWNEFSDEKWFTFVGYQSGHAEDDAALRWILNGPASTYWQRLPHRPFINMEPPYENHLGYQSKQPLSAAAVRRAVYWSLLSSPAAGVGYGGHGVWGWDDGTRPPTDHAGTGIPMPWRKALVMPGAQQMKHVATFFNSIDFWRLRPAAPAVADQPGAKVVGNHIAAARSDEKDLLVLYVPSERTVSVKLDMLPPSPEVTWFNPVNGSNSTAVAVVTANTVQFPTPAEGDWILSMKTDKEKAAAAAAAKQQAVKP